MSGSVDLIAAKQDLLKRLTFVFHKTPTHVAIFLLLSRAGTWITKVYSMCLKKKKAMYETMMVQMIWWSHSKHWKIYVGKARKKKRDGRVQSENWCRDTVAGHPASCLLPRDKESRCESVNVSKKSKLTFCLLMLLCIFFIYMSVVVNWDVLHCSLFTFMLKVCNQPCSKVKRRKLKKGEGNPSLLLSLEGANRCKCLHTLTHKHVGVHAHTHALPSENHILFWLRAITGSSWI